MKKSQIAVFLTIVLSVYGLVNYYIFITGLNAVPGEYKTIYSIVYLFLFSAYIIGRFLERKFLNPLSAFFVRVGSFWLGAMVYLLLFVIVIDVTRGVNLFTGFLPQSFYSEKYKWIFFLIVNSAVILIILSGYINAVNPRIKTISIKIGKKAGKLKRLRIAMISDIHLGTVINRGRLRKIVKLINSTEPDIILLPGDVVDEDIGPVIKQNAGEQLRTLPAKYGVFAVTGNHEYIGGANEACGYLEQHGITELRDRTVLIADSFYLTGREDRASKGFAGILRKPLKELLKEVDPQLPVILMDHQPARLDEARQHGIDLQLSGHTHNGQLWPFNFITRKIYEVSMGYLQKGSTHYYVSCGAGTWGPPIRTCCRPEIVQIDITFD